MRRPSTTRPIRARVLVVLTATVVAGSACGVTADDTAATVGDRTVSIDDVNAIVETEAIVGPASAEVTESRQPGELARTALMYEIQRLSWVEEAERWGAEPSADDIATAESQLDAELAQAGATLSNSVRRGAVESTAAQTALLNRWSDLDPDDDADLRLVYEGAPSRWRSWCLTVVAASPEQADRVESLLDDGVALEAVADRVEESQLLATPDECFVGSELPVELEVAAREARGGGRPEPVTTDLGGGEGVLFFEVHSATDSSFAEARDEVSFVAGSLRDAVGQLNALRELPTDADDAAVQQAQTAAQEAAGVLRGWVEDRMRAAEVNPRYGSGVVDRDATLGGGLEVAPPPRPVVPALDAPALPLDAEQLSGLTPAQG